MGCKRDHPVAFRFSLWYNSVKKGEEKKMEAIQEKASPQVRTERNTGVDLLRVVAAYYVIVLHILGIGGLLNACGLGSYQYQLCKAMLNWSYCAVNIFGVISGYVGYTDEERPHKLKKWLMLWLEVVFYGVLLTLLTLLLRPGMAKPQNIASMFIPVLRNYHWFFTAYTGIFFFIPLMNSAVRNASNKTLLRLLAFIAFLFAPVSAVNDIFFCHNGYSTIWLAILYLVGAILKKTRFGIEFHSLALLGVIVGLAFISFLLNTHYFCVDLYGITIGSQMVETYVYPGHLLIAICYVLLFSRLRFGKFLRRFTAFAAPGAFAVYLINTQRFVWNGYMTDHFASWASSSPLGIAARVAVTAFVFVLVSLIVDFFRRRIFTMVQRKCAKLLSCTRMFL